MTSLERIAPAFVDIAHRIVWATAATVAPDGAPRTRVLHPIWEWDGAALTGWVATSPASPKAADLEHRAALSVTYWDDSHDTCTADCTTTWENTPEGRAAGWERFATAPAPVGYDPSIVPGWSDPSAEAFGILRLSPTRLRVMPGTVMLRGEGELMTWRRSDRA